MEIAVHHFGPAWFIGKRISLCPEAVDVWCVWRSDSCSGTAAPLRVCVIIVCGLTNATC